MTAALPAGDAAEPGDWFAVTQDLIDRFAELTGDHGWIHTDPDRAVRGPHGTTIAHGFLIVSLLAMLSRSARPHPPGTTMAVNYGLNRVRFPDVVPSGSRVRARTREIDRTVVAPKAVHVTYEISVEVEGRPGPACVAEMICRYVG